MASKRGKISLTPGNFKGMYEKKPPLPRGKKPPKIIADALGIHSSMGVGPMMLGKLVGHPDPKVRMAVKKMLGGF